MKKARMNISHSRFILFKLKIFGEIVTTYTLLQNKNDKLNFGSDSASLFHQNYLS